jgi:hypothetical protein
MVHLIREKNEYEIERNKLLREFKLVFGDSGSKVVLSYLKKEHGLTIDEAVKNPDKLKTALSALLGSFGSQLVMKRIYQKTSPGSRGLGNKAFFSRFVSLDPVFTFQAFLSSARISEMTCI